MKMPLFVIVGLLIIPAGRASQVNVIESSIKSGFTNVLEDGRRVRVERRLLQATVTGAGSAESSELDVLMLYEPQSRLFWRLYLPHEKGQPNEVDHLLQHSIFYITNGRFTCFYSFAGSLEERESTARYRSMSEGQSRVLDELKETKEASFAKLSLFRKIDLGNSLPFAFYSLDGDSSLHGPELSRVSRAKGHWQLVLDGPNKNSAIVILNDDYELISASILPPGKSAVAKRFHEFLTTETAQK